MESFQTSLIRHDQESNPPYPATEAGALLLRNLDDLDLIVKSNKQASNCKMTTFQTQVIRSETIPVKGSTLMSANNLSIHCM